MIYLKHSSDRMLSFVRRHIRLCKQVANDANLIAQIQPAFDDLSAKNTALQEKVQNRENVYDDQLLADHILDDTVRNLYGKCKEYDRNNTGMPVLMKIFPDEKFGDIINMPFAREVLETENIVMRLQGLGEQHTLFPQAEELHSKGQAVAQAISNYNDAVREEKMAEAEVEISKEQLVRAYEVNYLDARKTYGKENAEKLFPKIDNSSKVTVEEEPVPADSTESTGN